ncbi:MAG: sigma-70 family RNA polymerase sigma factor [Lysobacteraceae bacterium]|nr:MAG: sigma-70 family RNA polymerase sigma factor [Xanthomonadaceae bacterium]
MVQSSNSLNPLQLNNWIRGAAQKDVLAFRQLYDASSPRLYGLALRILRRRELAEEVLQESFVSIWHHANDYQAGLSAPMTWMTTIVRNKSFDLLRRQQADIAIDGEDFDERVMASLRDPAANPAEALELSSEAKALAICMSALEEKHRHVVGLAFFHDLSHSDVAQKLALPIGTVKTWIRRSLARLQACLTAGGRAS